jgi:phenylacetate-coenzyme A ligase PaaK-like adenylate-forming protein
MREADLFFEIIDPETGKPVEEGTPGEVVFTTLTRRGMPLIRYRTGDISRFIRRRCPCGTVLKSMERVTGRTGGRVKLGAGGSLSMADLDEALFPVAGLLDFSAVLTCQEEKDRLHLDIAAMEAESEQIVSLARRAVGQIPVVRAASEKGALLVSLDVRQDGKTLTNGAGKRKIADLRGANRLG